MRRLAYGLISGIVHMRPLWALVLVTGGLFMTYAVYVVVLYVVFATGMRFEPSEVELLQHWFAALNIGLGLPFIMLVLGWPAAVSLSLNQSHGEIACVKPRFVSLCFFGAFAAIFIVVAYMASFPQGVFFPILLAVAMTFGIICPLYIIWSAARALVFVEEGRKVGIDRRIGTFFLFYFLPIGIYFVQRRLQRVVNPQLSE